MNRFLKMLVSIKATMEEFSLWLFVAALVGFGNQRFWLVVVGTYFASMVAENMLEQEDSEARRYRSDR